VTLPHYDVAIVGAGILGLAHALAAHRLGKRVVVLERDAAARGASIRNFGFVTVTGQEAGDCFERAVRAREIWGDVIERARVPALHHGLLVTARRPEAEAVIDAFLDTPMGAGCRRLSGEEARDLEPLVGPGVTAALHSPREVRVESRTAIARIAAWLSEEGVDIDYGTAVHAVETPRIETSRGRYTADTIVVCPGDDLLTLFPERIARYGVTRCKLHMLRVMPAAKNRLGIAIMSDLGLARYRGYSDLPQAAALAARLDAEQPEHRANGIHLIAVASADGSLVVGDSHHYDPSPDPFQPVHVDDLILSELDAVLALRGRRVTERWIGTYPVAPGRWRFTDAPDDATRIVMVTAGCGASTAFAIAEETIGDLFGTKGRSAA
jgi:FAD dependent oxidoreductase TIGR03364